MKAVIDELNKKHYNPKGYYEPWNYIDTKKYEQCSMKILLQQSLSYYPLRIFIAKGKLLIIARLNYPHDYNDFNLDWHISAIKENKLRKKQLIRLYKRETESCYITPTNKVYFKQPWASKEIKVTTQSLISDYPWLLSLLRGLWELLLTHSEKKFMQLKMNKECEDWETYSSEECLDHIFKKLKIEEKRKTACSKEKQARLSAFRKRDFVPVAITTTEENEIPF